MTKGVHPFAHDVEIIYLDNTFLLVYVTKSLGIFSSNGTFCINCIHTFVIACVLYPTRQSQSIIHKYRVYHINASPFCFALLKMSPISSLRLSQEDSGSQCQVVEFLIYSWRK